MLFGGINIAQTLSASWNGLGHVVDSGGFAVWLPLPRLGLLRSWGYTADPAVMLSPVLPC